MPTGNTAILNTPRRSEFCSRFEPSPARKPPTIICVRSQPLTRRGRDYASWFACRTFYLQANRTGDRGKKIEGVDRVIKPGRRGLNPAGRASKAFRFGPNSWASGLRPWRRMAAVGGRVAWILASGWLGARSKERARRILANGLLLFALQIFVEKTASVGFVGTF